MAKGGILKNFIKAFTSTNSGIQSDKKLSKEELVELKAIEAIDATGEIEWKLSSRIKASVSEKEAQKEAKAKGKPGLSKEMGARG